VLSTLCSVTHPSIMSANNTSTASCSGSDDVNMTSRCGKGCSTSVLVSVNYDQPELSVVALALLLVIVGTMLCNLLVGVALIRFRTLRNVSNLTHYHHYQQQQQQH